jgi:hypothetical protein
MNITFQRGVEVPGEPNGVRISNGDVELVVASSFGIRVLRYALAGGENVFGFLDPQTQGVPVTGGTWHLYGGHRLWVAPEDPARTYTPDNFPVRVEEDGASLLLVQPVEASGLVKEVRLTLAPTGTEVVVEHRVTNAAETPTELAVWSLSVMATRGTALLPRARFVPHPIGLLPVSRLVLWPYTDLSDARYRFGSRLLRLRQDPSATSPQKFGLYDAERGWAAYALGDVLFLKRYVLPQHDEEHVDLGSNVEVYTDAGMLELETLGPRVPLRRGETAVHVERWSLHRMTVPDDDAEAEAAIDALVAGLSPAG